MAISKVVYGNQTLIDLTSDTVQASDLASGKTAHGADGERIVGTNDFDSNTTDATATAAEILSGKSAYVNANKVTGSMPNRGAVAGVISTKDGVYSVPNGYHDGSGEVGIDSVEQAKIIEGNIKAGVEILGVTGTYTGEAISAQVKDATPYTTAQSVLPDAGYDYLSQVRIAPISYVETDNAAGGKTVIIGAVAPS